MGAAIGDPDEIRNFANALENYINNIDEETGRIESQFRQLGESWKDEQHQRFENDFNELRTQIAAFKEKTSEYPPHLFAMAADLEQYLRR